MTPFGTVLDLGAAVEDAAQKQFRRMRAHLPAAAGDTVLTIEAPGLQSFNLSTADA